MTSRSRKTAAAPRGPKSNPAEREPALRIVGGSMRGRKLLYSPHERTRPMKDRVREALFNLVGPEVRGMHALDLFAGTGALGFEALSRGAARATFIEQHFPTAALIRKNAQALGVADRCQVEAANSFLWLKSHTLDDSAPWLAFCSPPYAFYAERQNDMLEMIGALVNRSPAGSTVVVEADERFDIALLPEAASWLVRGYLPAIVAIHRH